MHTFTMKVGTKVESFQAKSIESAKRIATQKTGLKGRWRLIDGATLQKGHVELRIPSEFQNQV